VIIGNFFGAIVDMKTMVEDRFGWVREYPNMFNKEEAAELFNKFFIPYMKFPKITSIDVYAKLEDIGEGVEHMNTEIESVEIIVKYKQK